MKRSAFLLSGFLACCLLVTQPARANVIEPTPALPPTVGGYSLPTVCMVGPGSSHLNICVLNSFVSNFNFSPPFPDFSTGSEIEDGTALFTADFYQNNGTPTVPVLGSLLAAVSVNANIGFDFVNRSSPTQLGTFTGVLTKFDFSVPLLGHTFTGMLNPGMPSTGVTTISAVTGDGPFIVDSFFDVFAEFQVDNLTPVLVPEQIAQLTTPEPASVFLLLTAGAASMLARRRVRM